MSESDTLDFPVIDDAPLASTSPTARSEVATSRSGDVAAQDVDLQKVALAHFDPTRAALAVATKTLAGVVHDLSTVSKLDDAKSLRQRLINRPLADARKVSTNLKSKLTAVSKAVGVELAAIESGFEAAGLLITPQIEAREAELEADRQRAEEERRLKEAAAAARKAKADDQISAIRGCVDKAKGLPAWRIANGIAHVEALAFGEEWAEFAPLAAAAQAETLVAMRAMHAETLAAEQAAAAAEALRLENERQAAEIAAQQRALAVQQRRMEDIRRINARCADAQAAIVGRPAVDVVVMLETFLSATAGLDVSSEAFGDLAAMAEMAQSMVLTQLRSMLAEAHACVVHERKAKQEAEELAAAEAAKAAEEVVPPVEIADADERPTRDWPDLQTAEIAIEVANHDMVDDMAGIVAPAPAEIEVLAEPIAGSEGVAAFHRAAMEAIEAGGMTFLSHVASASVGPFTDLQEVGERSDGFTADTVAELLAHIAKAFDTRFPTQPKPSVEWWAELKRLAAEAA